MVLDLGFLLRQSNIGALPPQPGTPAASRLRTEFTFPSGDMPRWRAVEPFGEDLSIAP